MESEALRNRAALMLVTVLVVAMTGSVALESRADEEVFGYVKGAEPLPKGALEVVQRVTVRSDKGVGHYRAWGYRTEVEYGIMDKLSGEINILAMGINTSGILIDGYVPGDKKYGFKLSGVEGSLKYNFLSAAKDPIGLSTYFSMSYRIAPKWFVGF